MKEDILGEGNTFLLSQSLYEDLRNLLDYILLTNEDVVTNGRRDRIEVGILTSQIIVLDFYILWIPPD